MNDMKNTLIIVEDYNVKQSLEQKLKQQLKLKSVGSSRTETNILHEYGRIKIIIKDGSIDAFSYDEIKTVTKESLLAELLGIEEDIVVEDLVNEIEEKSSWDNFSDVGKVDDVLNKAFDTAKDTLIGTDIFDESQLNLEKLSNKLIQIIDAYSEFAKKGAK